MTPNILKYSNGWGHLIISVTTQIVAVILLLQHDATLVGVATGLLLGVSGYWYVTSAANAQQQAALAQQGQMIQVTPPPSAITIAPTAATAPADPGGSHAQSSGGQATP